jgi:hypothetical protein
MGINRSDNFFYTNPKPIQAYQRKQVGSTYVDWADAVEVNAALDIEFRRNKTFWIAGVFYYCDDDGVTYLPIGGPSTGATKFVKVPVITTANTITVTELGTATTLAMVVMDGIIFQDFVNNGNQISFAGTTLDMTNAGGVTAGGWLVIFYL